ncbi:endoplasmic reticulum retention protein [Phlyctochytrium bullatum]|nr:endoplasmic reticulum retention protein [Phlyctochytrium bullatum]
MNIFRFFADMAHLVSICILLLKIWQSKSASGFSGISFKTQALYLTVFITRYLDLFTKFYSLYNVFMKILFIGTSAWICYAMKTQFKATWDPALDTLRVEYLVGPCAILALIFNYAFTFLEVFWAFSIYLEAVAILPQLFQLTRTGECETITTHYLFALGAYRGLYIFNWIYRYFVDNQIDWISLVAGIVQTGLYCDFFYIYFTK